MNKDFPRVITLLRKEKGFSQKKVANDLEISQALLSHYEKGIRECGLDFVVKISRYYQVSCDYLLGISVDRQEQILDYSVSTEDFAQSSDKIFKGSVLGVLNKRLIVNSIIIIFDLLEKFKSKELTNKVSAYLMMPVYKMFRSLYTCNKNNPKEIFELDETDKASLPHIHNILAYVQIEKMLSKVRRESKYKDVTLSPQIISKDYPQHATSLYNLIKTSETNVKNQVVNK